MKDPKKQEPGRKGAEARRQKMEALQSELTAAKETVYNAENNKEYTMLHRNEQQAPEVVSPKREDSRCFEGTGWLMGIGLAVIAGAMLYTMRPVAVPPERQPHRVQHAPQGSSDGAEKTVTPKRSSRSLYDME